MNRKNGGVYVLPPHEKEDGSSWYRGTADAIYRNLKFVDQFDPEHVLILSGDHIYKMNYNAMLEYHKDRNADCTISVIDVPMEEASRFGILNTEEDLKIYEFEEKPAQPKSTLASMGVYIFKWDVLRRALLEDGENPASSHDFGKDILPSLLSKGRSMYAYPFKGYWRDVGTVNSLWEANMDLLSDNPPLNLNDPAWRIYTRNPNQPAQYVAPGASVSGSIINEGCIVCGHVRHSVLFYGVEVGEGSVITDSVIMPKVKIGQNVRIHKAIISENTVIEDGMEIGTERENEDEILLIDNRNKKRRSIPVKTV
ncbi:Glucose-1-phosphate adenylyltransferase [compost metagenome]